MPRKKPLLPETKAAAGAEQSAAASMEKAGAKTEGAIATFMKNEKWMGKKGLAVAGATVAVGATLYAGSKIFGKKSESQENDAWVERVSEPSSAERNR